MKQFLASFGAVSLIVVGIMLMPAPAQAASLTEAQVQSIIDLVESFGADDSILKNVEASLRGTASDDSSDSSDDSDNASSTQMSKLKLEALLRAGSSGEEVKLLQKILASDPTLYPEGLVTGFFGSLTEQAVKRLQAKFKLEQVGAVGPQTLARINEILALAGVTGDVPADLLNSRIEIKIEIKDGKEEIKIEVKGDKSGKGSDDDDDINDDNGSDDDSDDDEDEDGDDEDDDGDDNGSDDDEDDN